MRGAAAAVGETGGAALLVVCATARDRRELGRLGHSNVLFHDYATAALEDLVAPEPAAGARIADPIAELERVSALMTARDVRAVVSTDDYPGSTLACMLAERHGLPGPAARANLLCQHKYEARRAQRRLAPTAVPEFMLIDLDPDLPLPALPLPRFVKPVKSFFSTGALLVDSMAGLEAQRQRWRERRVFFEPFERLYAHVNGHGLGQGLLLAETPLEGHQVTFEGYLYQSEMQPLAVVDSIMLPGTISFKRFSYPSALPAAAQERVAAVARAVMEGIGYGDGLFNIEMMVDRGDGTPWIIEINPRMASQFADLYEKVDGFNTYEILLDLAAGRRPQPRRGEGRHRMAASCVLRTFANHLVRRVPTPRQVAELEAELGDARIEILATPGRRLSQEMQDDVSYRYGIVSLGGRDLDDILRTFERCRTALPFALDPV